MNNNICFSLCLGLLSFFISSVHLASQNLKWERTALDLPGNFAFGVDAVGIEGTLYLVDGGGLIFRSTDGRSWEEVGAFSFWTGNLAGTVLGDGSVLLYTRLGGDLATLRPDGTFITQRINTAFAGFANAVAEGNSRVVFGGGHGFVGSDPAWWVSTDNGATYTGFPGESRVGDVSVKESIKGLGFINDTFVAVGYPGEFWTSDTGETWTFHELPTVEIRGEALPVTLYDLEKVDGTLYACGSFSTIYRTTDGQSWEQVHQGATSYELKELYIDGDNWYAVSDGGGQAYSADGGLTWQSARALNVDLLNITGGGDFIFAGRYFAPAGGPIYSFSGVEFETLGGGATALGYTDGMWLGQTRSDDIYLGTRPFSILDEATSEDGVFFEHPWLGWYTLRSGGWFYHFSLGWVYTEAEGGNNVWLFADGLGWVYTQEGLWPSFYHEGSGHWGVYSDGPEWFWNGTMTAWQRRGEFGQEPWVVSADWLIGKTLVINNDLGEHTLEIVGADSVRGTFNVSGKTLVFSVEDTVTWFDSSSLAALPEGRRFSFDITDSTAPGIGDRVVPLVLTFEDAFGGSSLMTYTYLEGLSPVSGSSIPGTFTVSE